LLSGEISHSKAKARLPTELASGASPPETSKLDKLEEEIAALRGEVAELKQQFALFRKQFE